MYERMCKLCGKQIMQYRGAWFSRDDAVRCRDGGDYHEPVPIPTAESTRESIANFVDREAMKFRAAAREVLVDHDKRDRLEDKVSVLTTMAAHIRRGDDKAGT